MSFAKMDVHEKIVDALRDEQITEPTEIQDWTIPLILEGEHVIGISKTGSGKTAAFAVPVLDSVWPGDGIQAIVIAPTRELALQISDQMKLFGKNLDVSVATVFGGVSYGPQIQEMKRAEIVVGTPGRILDHIRRGNLQTDRVEMVVLDEADKMTEMGFIEDIEVIIDSTPDKRQVLLFGATISRKIENLQRKYMPDPVWAEAERHVGEEYLEQFYFDISRFEKFSLLMHLIETEKADQMIIFCSACRTADLVYRNLKLQKRDALLLHGKLSQHKRFKVIDKFNKNKAKLMVASPVAARGLDIQHVTHIINYDLSQDPEEYIHRVGRTARAGKSGKAITLLSDRDYSVFSRIENQFSLRITKLDSPSFKRYPFKTQFNDSRNGRGRRGSLRGHRHRRFRRGNSWRRRR